MNRKLSIIVTAIAIAVAACGGADSSTDSSIGGTTETTTTTAVVPPSEHNNESFRGIPPPTLAVYAAESGEQQAPCREYDSTETPYDVVSSHTEDLTALGWTISNLIRTGYRHQDAASFDATNGGRTIRAEAAGTGTATSGYAVCIVKK